MTRMLGLIVLVILGGCAAGAGPTVTPEAVARFQAIGSGLLSIAAPEAQIAGASPEIVTRIGADAQLAQAAITGLSPGMAQAAAAPSALTIRTAVEDALSAASTLPLPARVRQVVLALQVLLPVAEASIGVSPAHASPASMTPETAHAVLQGAAP